MHMLNNLKYEFESLIFLKRGILRDQTFVVDDTILYLKGNNMDKMWRVLDTFYLTFGAKINKEKFVVIWVARHLGD